MAREDSLLATWATNSFQYLVAHTRDNKRTYEGKFGDKYASFLGVRQYKDASAIPRRTNGVSFGPQISASQLKKSDSETGPATSITLRNLRIEWG